MSEGYNVRYVLYAKEHGRSVPDMLAFDGARSITGQIVWYLRWLNQQKQDFFQHHPECFVGWNADNAIVDQGAFTAFILNQVIKRCLDKGIEFSHEYEDAKGDRYRIDMSAESDNRTILVTKVPTQSVEHIELNFQCPNQSQN
jgi:hypothetical protein